MCGRIVLKAPAQQVAQEFELACAPDLGPRFNIAPTQPVIAALAGPTGRREARVFQWGLVPSWSRDGSTAARMFNARGETITTRPAFRDAFAARRCLLPSDGFYEWRRQGRERQPYYFHGSDGRLLALAGVWERWERPGGEVIESCSILTTAANDLMIPIHHRMPVVIAAADRESWLATPAAEAAALLSLLRPAPPGSLRMHPVASLVNRAANDGPELIAPATPPGPHQLDLFG